MRKNTAHLFYNFFVPSRNKSLKNTIQNLSEQILDGNFRSRPEAVETYGESGANGNLRRNMPLGSVVAAAAEYNHDRKDHDPGAVIVKKMAQAVVIHICFPPKMLQVPSCLVPSYEKGKVW